MHVHVHVHGLCCHTANLHGGAQAFPDGSAVVRRSADEVPGCLAPVELGPTWFLRRHAWYAHHVTAAPGQQLRMLPAIRLAAAHRRRPARPWNDADFSAAASQAPRGTSRKYRTGAG